MREQPHSSELLAVARQVDDALDALDVQHRVQRLGFPGCDDLDVLQAEAARHGRQALPLLEPLRGRRQGQGAVLPEAGRLAGLGLQAGEQLAGVLRQPGKVVGRAELPHQAGGVPGGAAGKTLALQQHHVRPARFRQVIGDAAADGAAAYNHDLRALG